MGKGDPRALLDDLSKVMKLIYSKTKGSAQTLSTITNY
jgi:hypothetical protein